MEGSIIIGIFSTNVSLYFETVQDTAIVTVEDDLSNGAISNDIQWPQPRFQDRDIVKRQIIRKGCKIEL